MAISKLGNNKCFRLFRNLLTHNFDIREVPNSLIKILITVIVDLQMLVHCQVLCLTYHWSNYLSV